MRSRYHSSKSARVVLEVASGGEGGPLTRYTARVTNNGTTWMDYNLNVGNLL
jgi:hypothetical protein